MPIFSSFASYKHIAWTLGESPFFPGRCFLPLAGVASLKTVGAEYGNEIIFLFMAGFFMGKSIERWQLHRRIALRMVLWIGTDPARTVLGFMAASAGSKDLVVAERFK